MALIEVDEVEYQAQRRVTDAMQKLMANPKTRQMVLQAQKTLNPDLPIPEIDATEPLRGEISTLGDKFDALQKQLAEERAERAQAEKMAKLRAEWDRGAAKLRANGYTDEGLQLVEKFMEDKGISDHEIAAAAFERLNPPAEPVKSVGGNRFDLFEPGNRTDESMAKLFANPEDPMALNSIINDTLRQVRGR